MGGHELRAALGADNYLAGHGARKAPFDAVKASYKLHEYGRGRGGSGLRSGDESR